LAALLDRARAEEFLCGGNYLRFGESIFVVKPFEEFAFNKPAESENGKKKYFQRHVQIFWQQSD